MRVVWLLLKPIIIGALLWLPSLFLDISDSWLLLMILVSGSLKYLVFDLVVASLGRIWPSFRRRPWYLLGYLGTVGADLWFVWGGIIREWHGRANASLAILDIFSLSPLILLGALLVMMANSLRRRRA